MLLCHCNVVSDRTVRAAVGAGAGSLDEVAAHCGAGTDCAGCHPAIEDLLEEAALGVRAPTVLAQRQRARRVAAAGALRATG